MKKRIFTAVVACVLVAMTVMSMCMTVSAASFSDAKKGVVTIIDSTETSMGSGFAIGKVGEPVSYIVTNDHVVDGENNTTAYVCFSMATNDVVTAFVLYCDPEKDFAILQLPEPTETVEPLVLCSIENADYEDGEFAALGYPTDSYLASDWLQFSRNDITTTRGGIKKIDTIGRQQVYNLDLDITNGNSGGPLVNENAEVVGINTFGVSNQNYAICIDDVIKVLEDEEIPFSQVGDSKINLVLILIIAGAVILVGVLVLVIILVVNSGKKKQVVITPPTGPGNPVNGGPQKTAPQPTPIRLIAVGGALNGKVFNVERTAKLGRDAARCQISFPVNTQGVSGVHCEINFDGSVCYIVDLNSSYGTYTANGEKLIPNQPKTINSGDKFYLASPENTFEVRF